MLSRLAKPRQDWPERPGCTAMRFTAHTIPAGIRKQTRSRNSGRTSLPIEILRDVGLVPPLAQITQPGTEDMIMAETDAPKAGHNSKKLDFDKAAAVLKKDLTDLSTKGAKVRGDQSAAWKRIEEMGLNKRASKAVFSLMDQGEAEVSDYLRTFIGLLDPCGLGIIKDMVDLAEDKTAITVPLIAQARINVGDSVATAAMKETAAQKASK